VPCVEVLRRNPGRPQTGRSLAERREGVDLSVKPGALRNARSVVLVDDVVTTGTTLRDAARAVRSAGAQRVAAVALARTPRSR
jgi:predicted amidophosphoribosyltransferase